MEVEAKEPKSLVWDKVKKYVADHAKPVVVTMNHYKGQGVIYFPATILIYRQLILCGM